MKGAFVQSGSTDFPFRVMRCFSIVAASGALLITGCASVPTSLGYLAPVQTEGSATYSAKPGWTYTRQAVAAANPLATDAGLQVLRAGGSALDAAIAVQMVLTLVEPQSSGIGGGAFLLHHDGRKVQAWDGRETAPASAHERMFLSEDGKPVSFMDAVLSPRSVGVPGAVRMLEAAHQQHGRLPWALLFEPAITLSEQGFRVSARLHAQLKAEQALKRDPVASRYFYDASGQPWPVGHLLRNPELAAVLRQIAAQGSRALHEGPVAQAIVDALRPAAGAASVMTLQDLAAYRPVRREALCHGYSAHVPSGAAQPAAGRTLRVCGFPPPSSGAVAVGQILGILSHTPAHTLSLAEGVGGVVGTRAAAPGADWLHLYTEAARLAFADRAQYLADPAFVPAPVGGWQALLHPAYLRSRAALIGPQSMKTAQPGDPAAVHAGVAPSLRARRMAPMPDQPEYGTSHISIIDRHGNALAMTTTIEAVFGARRMVSTDASRPGGFLLNNELTDFSFAPSDAQGRPIANRVQAGKRPRSSMSPTLVFDADSGELMMSLGSPGGAQIIHFTAKTLYGMLHWGLTPQQAIDLPNFSSLNGPSLLEAGRFDRATVDALRARGAEVREIELTSGLQALRRSSGVIQGGADPRREGVVLGD
jgi:gamma-glutamyltranspeptidase/glutathione hydrolase